MTTVSSHPKRCRYVLYLAALFALALLPRLFSVQSLGQDWDYPGSFTLVNFDEGGSCRAALGGFDYSPFIGRQTIAITTALGNGPDAAAAQDRAAAKAYCHSAAHIQVARTYSAVSGALTVVLIALIALMLAPSAPVVAWMAGALLALSGFHISESHSGTVDASSVFFIYLFIALMVYAATRKSTAALAIGPLLLVPAIWTKYWVFALFAYVSWVPLRLWRYCTHGISSARLCLLVVGTAVMAGMLSNSDFQRSGLYPLLAAFYLLIPWRRVRTPMVAVWLVLPPLAYAVFQVDLVHTYTTGSLTGSFGNSYGAIGWHKWLRNLLNVPLVLVVGIGLPACLFIPAGIGFTARRKGQVRGWLCFTPLLVFALYMAFVSPVTYYRHYLALLPAAALLAACGLYVTAWYRRRVFMALLFLWSALLALDTVSDYHLDPRIELREWYAGHPDARVFFSFYASPPPQRNSRLFQPEYAFGDAAGLRQAQYLILSENWYDTAFANELNGLQVSDLQRLIKTKPEYAEFYRTVLANRHPHLQLERAIEVNNFMPELVFHRWIYGTFQLFVGDIRIYRVIN